MDLDAPTVRARPDLPRELGFPGGSRIAGAVMVVSGGALGFGLAKFPAGEHRWALGAAVLVLAALAVGLLLQTAAARWIAVTLAFAAAVVVAEDLVRVRLPDLFRDPLPRLLRDPLRDLVGDLGLVKLCALAAFLAGGLVLLLGRPRAARVTAGVLLALPVPVLAVMVALGW